MDEREERRDQVLPEGYLSCLRRDEVITVLKLPERDFMMLEDPWREQLRGQRRQPRSHTKFDY